MLLPHAAENAFFKVPGPGCCCRVRFADASRQSRQSGQVLVIGAFIILALSMIAIGVANVGMMVAEKIHLQDTVDASAYSAAVVEARFMNLSAYINRAMVANYDAMAFNDALWATVAAHDHGSAIVTAMLYGLSAVVEVISLGLATPISMQIDRLADALRDGLHGPMHRLNQQLDGMFAQDQSDLNRYIDMFNADLLSMYEGLLFAAVQSARHDVIKRVAAKMDREVMMTTVSGLGAETVSFDELSRAVDYIAAGRTPRSAWITENLSSRFKLMAGQERAWTDEYYYLGAVTESSLNNFVMGRTRDGAVDLLRQFNLGDLISDIVAPLETALEIACRATSWPWETCDSEIQLDLGAVMREGQEDRADQRHVPVVANRRLREANGWVMGLRLRGIPGAGVLNWAIGQHGYTSGDRRSDVANAANVTISVEKGIPSPERFLESIRAGSQTSNPVAPPLRGLNAINIQLAQLMGVVLPVFLDDHWDGTYDPQPVNYLEIWPPGPGQLEGFRYAAEVFSHGETEEGVPNYDFRTNLEDTGFMHYVYDGRLSPFRPGGNSRGGKLTGPSVAALGVKRARQVNGLKGLGISNEYDLSAISRAQVYYLHNPNRRNEQPSSFNPHWAAKLAPLDKGDTPVLLSEGLPFLESNGLPVMPTR